MRIQGLGAYGTWSGTFLVRAAAEQVKLLDAALEYAWFLPDSMELSAPPAKLKLLRGSRLPSSARRLPIDGVGIGSDKHTG